MKKYSLKEDHKAIKKQIKEWEKTTNRLVLLTLDSKVPPLITRSLEEMSHEMMAINL